MIEPVNHRFATVIDYQSYRLLKKLRSDDDVAHGIPKMVRKMAMQMISCIF